MSLRSANQGKAMAIALYHHAVNQQTSNSCLAPDGYLGFHLRVHQLCAMALLNKHEGSNRQYQQQLYGRCGRPNKAYKADIQTTTDHSSRQTPRVLRS